jgi:hypothetical protein
MKFIFANKEYECKESQRGEFVDIFHEGVFKTTITVHDIQEARLSLFPSSFVLAYIAARNNNS